MNIGSILSFLERSTEEQREYLLRYVDFAAEAGCTNPSSAQLKEGLHRRKQRQQRETFEQLKQQVVKQL